MQELTIEHFPSLNQIINASRGNKYKSASIKKSWTDLVARLARDSLKPIEGACWVSLKLTYPRTNCDADNLQAGAFKVMLDGLVKAEIIAGDSVKTVQSPIFTTFSKGNDRTATLYLFDNFREFSRYIKTNLDT